MILIIGNLEYERPRRMPKVAEAMESKTEPDIEGF
jgi:hypothetical protein